ncbi:IS66 family insertion sequence element accessory protein TnpB [Methylohalobius crimeensis]|uniref:IS66 family insertion sequence element accessory protein TnpB n=1 Tax=Methylohalobius crimeensis TaxID=244365 RepID=UPI0003B49007|nr:IS66 family insertion sequence element accessory protein TnpB [Methylohalobius crimeensis]
MLRPSPSVQTYFYMEPVDMRKSIDGLAALVENELELSPMREAVFVFCNRGRDKIKLLYWERNGFVVWYKRLEKQRFRWPRHAAFNYEVRDGRELNYLLDGFDIWHQSPHQTLHFNSVS